MDFKSAKYPDWQTGVWTGAFAKIDVVANFVFLVNHKLVEVLFLFIGVPVVDLLQV